MSYPVTTPFGQVPGYPLNNGFHNGIDYGYPMGTPVIVNGVTIGLSNNTGASTGPHLHVGRFVNGQVTDPGVGNGFQFNSAVVFDTGSDATNGNYVRITGDGALWNYLHLEKILVGKGQILKGGDMPAPDPNQINQLVTLCWGPGAATQDDVAKLNAQANVQESINLILGDGRTAAWDAEVYRLQAQPTNVKPYSGPPLYEKE